MVTYHSLNDPRPEWEDENDDPSPRRRRFFITATCCLALLPLAYEFFFAGLKKEAPTSPPLHADYASVRLGSHWPGWRNVAHMIVLGDSWSSTGFDVNGNQPSANNPLGNPAFPGATVTNGQNWVDYLLYTYNQSAVLAVDLAVGGATIDTDLIAPDVPKLTLRSLKAQVELLAQQYSNSPTFPWAANDTLVSIWIGVNDITAYTNETKAYFSEEFDELTTCLDDIHDLGARNYLLFNLPPLDKSPAAPYSELGHEWPVMIDQWNQNFTDVVYNFTTKHEDSTIFVLDAHALFTDVIADPCRFAETCGFTATTESCIKYAFGAVEVDYKHPECPYSVDKYFWINRLHPSTQTHNMTAHVVSQVLTVGDDSFG